MSSPTLDPAQRFLAETLAEPFRIKVIEKVRLASRGERERLLREAFYSPAYMNSEDVFIDLLTDSGTGAMSDAQWAGLMRGDEAYVRSRNFLFFEETVQDVTGLEYIIPTHQGRGAENIIMQLLVEPDDVVLSNTHFDTTRAHVERRRALALDLVADGVFDFTNQSMFKGNFDAGKLEAALSVHKDRVSLVIITVLNNMACSSPVSMANIRETSKLARARNIPVFIDACRFAENAYFIKQYEPGYSDKSILEIVREMISYADGCWMSAKKDALVNVGGFLALREQGLARKCQELLVLYEGFPTYGGLARRDLEATAIGLREGLEEPYLAHRIGLVQYLGDLLEASGIAISRPVGGSGVFVNVGTLYPHLPLQSLPNIALFSDFYLLGGVRVGAAPFSVRSIDPAHGETTERMFSFARLAIPRRVYGKAHLEYVGKVAELVRSHASQNRGYRIMEMPSVLGHFFAKYAVL